MKVEVHKLMRGEPVMVGSITWDGQQFVVDPPDSKLTHKVLGARIHGEQGYVDRSSPEEFLSHLHYHFHSPYFHVTSPIQDETYGNSQGGYRIVNRFEWAEKDPLGYLLGYYDVVRYDLGGTQLGQAAAGNYDEHKHPRDDHGQWIHKHDLHLARSDAGKAGELRSRVSHPNEQKKLEDMISPANLYHALGRLHPEDEDVVIPTNSLGISRRQMPQVARKHVPGFLEYLHKNGIDMHPDSIPVSHLKPTQNELSASQMAEMAGSMPLDKLASDVLASNDGYLLDGHHRWGALHQLSPLHRINATVVGLGISDLMKHAHAYGQTRYKGVGEKDKPQVEAYEPGEQASKGWAKWVSENMLKDMPAPQHLPEEHDSYFTSPEGAIELPMESINPAKARPDGIKNAKNFMWAARKGLLPKRKPVYVSKNQDGSYQLLDGNSTYANAQESGWKSIRAIEVPAERAKEFDHAPKKQETRFFSKEDHAHLPDKPRHAVDTAGGYEGIQPKAHEANGHLAELLNLGKGIGSQLGFDTLHPDTPWSEVGERLKKPGGFVLLATVKGKPRSEEKVNTDYNGDWGRLHDMVRATIAVDNLSDIGNVVRKMKESGVKFAKPPKDRFASPLGVGYRDLLANVTMPNGMIAELQVHLKPMLQAKEFGGGHKLYNTMRDLDAKYQKMGHRYMSQDDFNLYKQAFEESEKLYNGIWEQHGT